MNQFPFAIWLKSNWFNIFAISSVKNLPALLFHFEIENYLNFDEGETIRKYRMRNNFLLKLQTNISKAWYSFENSYHFPLILDHVECRLASIVHSDTMLFTFVLSYSGIWHNINYKSIWIGLSCLGLAEDFEKNESKMNGLKERGETCCPYEITKST